MVLTYYTATAYLERARMADKTLISIYILEG